MLKCQSNSSPSMARNHSWIWGSVFVSVFLVTFSPTKAQSLEYRTLRELVGSSHMAIKGQVENVDQDVALLKPGSDQGTGTASLLSTRVVTFTAAEVWLEGDRLSLHQVTITLPSDSLGVQKGDRVIWLLSKTPDGIWDFTKDRASYFILNKQGDKFTDLQQTSGVMRASLLESLLDARFHSR